jgi:hypothetical protein
VIAASPSRPLPALPVGVEEIEAPDGGVRSVPPAGAPAPAVPGVYFLRRGARRVGALVVNVEAEETDLRRLRSGELAGRVRARGVRVVERESSWAPALFASGARRPLTAVFLGVALAALLLEAIVARRGGGARAPRAAAAA